MTGQADMSGTIDYRQMYAQAVWELKHGRQYWFDNDDEQEITRHNAAYQMCSSIEESLHAFFIPTERGSDDFMTTTAVQQQLRKHLMAVDVPTLAKLGRALKHLHYPEGSKNGLRGYFLKARM
jgi:predicted P-loop ATPase